MSFHLSFDYRERYGSLESGINIKTTLRSGELFINCEAKIDTGAEVCLFQRAVGEALEIQVESGVHQSLETLTGVLTAYGHEIVLETLGLQLQTIVYFSASHEIKRNLLGRQGW